jgi:hypothetical protein
VPANPLVILDLDRRRGAPEEAVRRAAGLVAAALPITVGVVRGPVTPGLAPLAAAASMTLANDPSPTGMPTLAPTPQIVPVGDIQGVAGQRRGPAVADLDTALGVVAASSATLTGTRHSSRIWLSSGPLTELGSAVRPTSAGTDRHSQPSRLTAAPDAAAWSATPGQLFPDPSVFPSLSSLIGDGALEN